MKISRCDDDSSGSMFNASSSCSGPLPVELKFVHDMPFVMGVATIPSSMGTALVTL